MHWRKQDGRLPERAYVEHGTLTISNIQKGDSGVYVCRAESDEDVVEQHVTITVGGKKSKAPIKIDDIKLTEYRLFPNYCLPECIKQHSLRNSKKQY